MTEFEERVLKIVREHQPLGTYLAAKLIWPDNRFRKPWLVVNLHMGRLIRKGWVWREYSEITPGTFKGYTLTAAGREALRERHEQHLRENGTASQD